jgi:hypothetical protein
MRSWEMEQWAGLLGAVLIAGSGLPVLLGAVELLVPWLLWAVAFLSVCAVLFLPWPRTNRLLQLSVYLGTVLLSWLVVLTAPAAMLFGLSTLLLAVAVFKDEATLASEGSGTAGWVNGIVYANMALTGAYSYLRAVSSNRRLAPPVLDATGPARTPTREEVLSRELHILASQRWRVQSVSGFEAIVVRQKRPNHALHLALTIVTVYLWAFVWVAQTRSSRRNPRYEYRRVVVDAWGHWSVEDVPPAVADSVSATDR